MLWLQVARGFQFRRLAARGETPPPWFTDELGRMARRLGVCLPASLIVPGLGCPVVWCLGRAKLLWPARLIEGYEPDRARGVIVHELAHLRRRDHWVIWLEMAAACLWWWNPLFWYVRRRVRLCAEMACDAWVVWALPDQRRTYAESLIEVAQFLSRKTAAAPAWGAIGETRKHFERRLTMIFRASVPRRLSWGGMIAIGLLALIVLPGWSHGQAQPQQTSPQAASQGPAAGGADANAKQPVSATASQRAPRGVALNVGLVEAGEKPEVAAASEEAGEQGQQANQARAARGSRTRGSPYPGGMSPFGPGQPSAESRAPKTIQVFRLKHRDPGEMLQMVTALFRLMMREDAVPAGEVTVLAVVKVPLTGYPGGMPYPYSPGTSSDARGMPSSSYTGPGMGMPMGMPSGMMPGGGYGTPGSSYMGEEMGMYPPGATPGFAGQPPDPRELRLTVDHRTRALIARASQEAMETVRKLVAALDTPEDSLPAQIEKLQNLRLLKFEHRSSEEMIRVLGELGIRVEVTPVPYREEEAPAAMFVGQRGGMLIAAGPEGDLKEIEELIKALDIEGKGATGPSDSAGRNVGAVPAGKDR